MSAHFFARRLARALAGTALAALALAATASAHARLSPPVSVKGLLALYSLAVPTEQSGATTKKVVLTVPSNFSIDSFVPSPGWRRTLQQSGSGSAAVIQQVTWSGGSTPTGEDSLFQFLATPATSGTYRFTVQQTYSNGQIVNWSGPETADHPAPTIEVKDSLGGGAGTSALTIVALVLAALALLAGGFALAGGRAPGGDGGRPLA